MPLAPQSNRYLVGIHKQTNEATPGTVADYTGPLLTGTSRPMPMQDTGVIAMTDANATEGDLFKNAGEHWEASVTHAAWDDMLGTELVGLWPTDTATGAAPSKIHTFTGLGGTPPWISMYADEFTSGSLSETFAKGICSGIDFEFSTERPLKVTYHAVGQVPSVATFTSTVTKALTDGFFTPLAAANGALKFEEDNATAALHTNVQGGKVSVIRDVTPVMTADGVTVSYLSLGVVRFAIHLDLIWENWDAYKATYYGAAAGTAASSVLPPGSLDLSFGHSSSATSIFQLKADKVAFLTTPPVPDPAATPLTVAVDLAVLKPASGDHLKPILTNNVTPAY